MTAPRRSRSGSRSARRRRPAPTRDFWFGTLAPDPRSTGPSEPTNGGPDAAAEPTLPRIRPSDDPTAMVRSLGPPPFPGGETIAQHYFTAVYQKAATLAIALAAASDLLDTTDLDTTDLDTTDVGED
jgi:hypothetical protein